MPIRPVKKSRLSSVRNSPRSMPSGDRSVSSEFGIPMKSTDRLGMLSPAGGGAAEEVMALFAATGL